MKKVLFNTEEKEHITQKIKRYFIEELDEEIGQFDAEFLLEFFGNEIGAYYYNQGLQDAMGMIESHTDALKDTLYTMEEPTH